MSHRVGRESEESNEKSAERGQGESKNPVREDTYLELHSAHIDAICYTTTKACSRQGLLLTKSGRGDM